MTRLVSHPSSFRVFRGYRKADLPEADFLAEVGDVFMPGTPLLLQPLGLAGYLPALLPEAAGAVDLPDEVAVIAYASRERYENARNRNIQGRMYTHTHLAVFDMVRSRSQYPSPIDGDHSESVAAFFLKGVEQDWQSDGDVVFWAGLGDHSSSPEACARAIGKSRASLAGAGVLECIGQAGPGWATLWLLLDRFVDDDADVGALGQTLSAGITSLRTIVFEVAERLVWRDSVPTAPARRGHAFSYIFERASSQFLR